VALLQGVYDAGIRHFDSAEIYKTGNVMKDSDEDTYNETVLGKFFAKVPRDSFTVATKYMPFKYEGASCEYAAVKASLVASLKRFNLDYVDIYYCHRVPSKEAGVAFATACKQLMEEGLIKSVGLSEVSGSWFRAAHAACPIATVQQEWSLLTRSAEPELVPTCVELGVAIVAYSPLARNLLAVKNEEPPTDWRASLPRYSPENLAANRALYDKVNALAEAKGCTSAALSLSWLFHKATALGVSVMPIPGSTKLPHVVENLAAVDVKLEEADMQVLEALAEQVAGERGDKGYLSVGMEAQSS